ncbi:unnamed protein product [Parnassius apollo]|uniref:(apollo) hypothetical protein n=1 Tax=Parnassius apollo TaxID=110799 RepID=A0A8S3XSE3_PARAO|nr:unnamed protein product [Parnassius apollo]
MPQGDVLAPEPETKKITQINPIDEVLTADVIQDMPPRDVVFAPEPEIKRLLRILLLTKYLPLMLSRTCQDYSDYFS